MAQVKFIQSGTGGDVFGVRFPPSENKQNLAVKIVKRDFKDMMKDSGFLWEIMTGSTLKNDRYIEPVLDMEEWKSEQDMKSDWHRQLFPQLKKHRISLPKMAVISPLETGDLFDFLDGKLSFHEKLDITWDLACAINRLHNKGILHGDIKPENILVQVSAQPKGESQPEKQRKYSLKLADFDYARFRDALHIPIGRKGTKLYMAPELWLTEPSKSYFDIYPDLFALGVTLFVLWFEHLPHFWSKLLDTSQEQVATTLKKVYQYHENANVFLALLAYGKIHDMKIKATDIDDKRENEERFIKHVITGLLSLKFSHRKNAFENILMLSKTGCRSPPLPQEQKIEQGCMIDPEEKLLAYFSNKDQPLQEEEARNLIKNSQILFTSPCTLEKKIALVRFVCLLRGGECPPIKEMCKHFGCDSEKAENEFTQMVFNRIGLPIRKRKFLINNNPVKFS